MASNLSKAGENVIVSGLCDSVMNVDSIPEEKVGLRVGFCIKFQLYRMSEAIQDRFDGVTGTLYATRASYSNLSPFVYPNP